MSNTDTKHVKIALDATVRRGFGHGATWSASVLGLVNGHGATMGEAREDLTRNVESYVVNATSRPVFAVDDDGSRIVVVAEGSGSTVYRWPADGGRPREVSICEGTPSQVVGRVSHWTAL